MFVKMTLPLRPLARSPPRAARGCLLRRVARGRARARHGRRHEHHEHGDRRLLDRRHAGHGNIEHEHRRRRRDRQRHDRVAKPDGWVAAGASNEALLFLVTNTGNSAETFTLAGDSVLVGDDFDPAPAAPFIYFDSDGSGDLSPADTPYVAGSNDPLLAADASVAVLLVNDIPLALPDGERGRSELRATAGTGTGAPGTVFAGQGSGGVDAVVGTSGGEVAVFGEYLVGDIQISAVKSQSVLDPFGGSRPVPAPRSHYQIVVTATGTGAARRRRADATRFQPTRPTSPAA